MDRDWEDLGQQWEVRSGTTYLNHGSFGLPPKPVRDSRSEWIQKLNEQPMDFFVRQLETHVDRVLTRLGEFLGTERSNLVFADNATYAMNVVADGFPLKAGDEVLLNDHEYGAVHRIWARRCQRTDAAVVTATLPAVFESSQQVLDCLFEHVNQKTKLMVVSHITSPTAVILPVEEICREAQARGIAVCIDGPHALAQVDVNLNELGCDFYTASCHKWLCATLGSGFLYASPKWHEFMEPINKSWGRLLPALPEHWTEEFTWSGTRDVSAFLSIETAIEFMESIGIQSFQNRSRYLTRYVRGQLEAKLGTEAIVPDDHAWYGSMAQVPLPDAANGYPELQHRLWEKHQIEVPIIELNDRWYVRVSAHLYNSQNQMDRLIESLEDCLSECGSVN